MLGVLMYFPAAMWQLMTGPCGSLSLGHVTTYASSTPHHPCFVIFPHHLTCGCMVYHVDVWTATWHFPIGPWIDRKSPKLSDTWQPLMIPHHHVTSCWHQHDTCRPLRVPRTLYLMSRIDVDVSSTDVDLSPLIGLG
jgi:hypothetical protein